VRVRVSDFSNGRVGVRWEEIKLWIASKPNAFLTTLLVGFIAGFFLGAHAVLNSNATAFTTLGCVAIGAALGYAACRAGRPSPLSPFLPSAPRNPKSSPPSDTIDDAQAALTTLGYSAREARIAVASALASLGDDATVSTIVRAAFRKA
jgi:hypothetical protein